MSDLLKKAERNVYSQFGEDGVLDTIFSIIGTANKHCFECGAADGIFFSNTRRLIEDGWSATLIEADELAFKRLQTNSAQFGDQVKCVHTKAGLDNPLEAILAACGAPTDLDLAIIDVDGQDYYLFNSLLRYQPRVVVVEFDPGEDPWFVPAIGAAGQAGIGAMHRLASGKFYTVVHRTWCNLICVQQPLDRLLGLPGAPAS